MTRLLVSPLSFLALPMMLVACGPGPQDPLPSTSSSSGGVSSSGNTSTSSSSGGPICPQVACRTDLVCELGPRSDAQGCPTCECNPPSTSSSGGPGSSSGGHVCQTGGACRMYCEHGYVTDANGCETCQCLPPPVCTGTACFMYCEFGSVKDSNGCDTCECLPPPSCRADADCAPGSSCSFSGVCVSTPPAGCATVRCSSATPLCVACGPNENCAVKCVAQDPPDCRVTGCGSQQECRAQPVCEIMPCVCDPNGPNGCTCPPAPPCAQQRYSCEPVSPPQDCRTTGCPGREDQCVPVETPCYVPPCDCPAGSTNCGCATPVCNPTYVCQPAQPPQDCRVTGCGDLERCVAQPVCAIAVCVCDPATNGQPCLCPPPPPCAVPTFRCEPITPPVCNLACPGTSVCEVCTGMEDCVLKCVQPRNACAAMLCGPGDTCQEVTYCTGAIPPADADGGFTTQPPPGGCFTQAQCVPVNSDPCSTLTEAACMLDQDQCDPVYTQACGAPGGGVAPCSSMYMGCYTNTGGGAVDGGAGTGGGTGPAP